jgi:hypothetical protein
MAAEVNQTHDKLNEVFQFMDQQPNKELEEISAPYIRYFRDIYRISDTPPCESPTNAYQLERNERNQRYRAQLEAISQDPLSLKKLIDRIEEATQMLDPRSQTIVRRYYGIDESGEPKTLEEIAAQTENQGHDQNGKIGVTTNRIRQILNRQYRRISYFKPFDVFIAGIISDKEQ